MDGDEEDITDDGMQWDSSLSIASLQQDYAAGIPPTAVIEAIYERIDAYKSTQPSVWLHLESKARALRAARDLLVRYPATESRPPLFGVPFSIKDNFDVAGIPTTIGCPALTSTPTASSAMVYEKCIAAGALFVGKTNMEQLASGMTGCRSPYGTLHSTFSSAHCVGGSSSGAAVSVSEGLVGFALGSDTAGSIRVPAAFNGLVGFKPTKGTVSAEGVAPASALQDCVSFLTLTVEDAQTVWEVCKGFDKHDVFAKPYFSAVPRQIRTFDDGTKRSLAFRFGVPPDEALEACSSIFKQQFSRVVQALRAYGGQQVELNWQPFAAANELLYNSSLVTERLTILPDGWFAQNKQLLHPVTRQVLEGIMARQSTAADVFRDLHRQAALKRAVEEILTYDAEGDVLTVLVVPTTPFHPTIAEVSGDPLGLNGQLGTFAHFANVLDLVGVALPCGNYAVADDDDGGGRALALPFGVTVLAGCGQDAMLLELSRQLEEVVVEGAEA